MDYKNALAKPKLQPRTTIYAYEARLIAEHVNETGSGRVGRRVEGILNVINRAVYTSMQNGMFSFPFKLPDIKTSWSERHTEMLVKRLVDLKYNVKRVGVNEIDISW